MRSTYSDYNKVYILQIIYPQPEKKNEKNSLEKKSFTEKGG